MYAIRSYYARSLKDEATQAFKEILQLEKQIAQLNNEIAESSDYHSSEYLNKLDKVTELHERFQLLSYNFV